MRGPYAGEGYPEPRFKPGDRVWFGGRWSVLKERATVLEARRSFYAYLVVVDGLPDTERVSAMEREVEPLGVLDLLADIE